MLLDWLGQGLVALTLSGCVSLIVVTLGLLYLLSLHLALRRKCLAQEARALAHPLPPDAALPHVVVQIPVFNEGLMVERAIASAAQLDWPQGKLHIQVCDDSTDETTDLARAAAQRAARAGTDVVIIRRPDRSEFKAGNLKNAMAQSDHAYFAIFDADIVQPPDFLRRCMTVLLAAPELAFVQARPDFLNADDNALTRAQAILLNYHYGFEQATRSWAGHVLPFNGSCGIWRRAAIEAGGGWQGDTLLEDWDLSYRAWMRGWRGTFVTAVTAAGELPVTVDAWTSQQRRWATGGGQVARKVLLSFRGVGNLSLRDYGNALMPLATWLGYLLFSATLFAGAAAMLLRPSQAWMLGWTMFAVFASAAAVLCALMLVANRTVRRKATVTRIVLDFPMVLMLCLYISWANLRSLPGTLLGRPRAFVRTPKRG